MYKDRETEEVRKTEITMRNRTVEELNKLGKSPYELAKLLGCPTCLVNYWMNKEGVPSHHYLNKLHNLGCDILYIITGERRHGN